MVGYVAGWGAGWLCWLFVPIIFFFVIFLLARGFSGRRYGGWCGPAYGHYPHPHAPLPEKDAVDILRERLASGDIDVEDFTARTIRIMTISPWAGSL